MEQLEQILFIDIETVPAVPDFNGLSPAMQQHWEKKAKFLKPSSPDSNGTAGELFVEKSGIFSEFAKVVCIGFAVFYKQGEEWKLRLKALTNDDEKALLGEFCETVTKLNDRYPNLRFCGHNIKEFDIPFLCRRMLIHGLGLPTCMQLGGKKPWEIVHIDTLELWKFGDYKHFTSLALLAEVLGIPSPKDDIDGSMVADVYWKEHNLQRIAKYCLQDVLTSAKVFLRLRGITDMAFEPVHVNE